MFSRHAGHAEVAGPATKEYAQLANKISQFESLHCIIHFSKSQEGQLCLANHRFWRVQSLVYWRFN